MFARLDGFQKPSKVLRVHQDSFLVTTTKKFRLQGPYYKLQTYEAAANIHEYTWHEIYIYAMTERKSLKTMALSPLKTMALSPKSAAGQLKIIAYAKNWTCLEFQFPMHLKYSFIFKQRAQNRWENLSEIEPYNKRPSTRNVIISKRAEARGSHFSANHFVTYSFVLIKTTHILTPETLK